MSFNFKKNAGFWQGIDIFIIDSVTIYNNITKQFGLFFHNDYQ